MPAPPIGHDPIIARLGDALARGTLHHALLFEGPPGVGKRTVALHLARLANCEAEPGCRPCGRCRTCTSIAAGNHPDVLIVGPAEDRASGTIPVAAIREVVRVAGYHRYGARRRFVVIDPAEAMQDPAANALLKTLEEPPPGTGFVLIATGARALLPTIVSRCQRVRFGPVPLDTLARWLADQGVDGAREIAAASLGCPGTALALAEGGLADRRAVRDRLVEVLEGDLGALYTFSQKTCAGGRALWRHKVDTILEVLEELLRDAALHATGARAPRLHADAPDLVARWASALWPSGVVRCHRALSDARLDLARMVSGRTALDALLTRFRDELHAGA